jgi:hypothetical protein
MSQMNQRAFIADNKTGTCGVEAGRFGHRQLAGWVGTSLRTGWHAKLVLGG